MKKYIKDLIVSENTSLNNNYSLLKLTSEEQLPEMKPGQFAEVLVDNSQTTFLRRPISINYVDRERNELWLLVQKIGDGTRKMCEKQKGEMLNLVFPLGNTFTIPENIDFKPLLIGGGVGVAPMLFLGSEMHKKGIKVDFLLGARSAKDILLLDEFKKYGNVYVTTEDGSMGEKGFVTNHSILCTDAVRRISAIYTCGPTPMMKAVAAYANKNNISCEVSLENTMACGVGACLCCVTKTKEGHKCVCTDGPVFNVVELDNFV
jgi:dihydroorotate dehydrogenase electron transfer subunit